MTRWQLLVPIALASACASFHPSTINDVEISVNIDDKEPDQCREVGFVTCDIVWWTAAECPALMTDAAKRAGGTRVELADIGVGAVMACDET